MSYRSAKRWLKVRERIAAKIDAFFTWGTCLIWKSCEFKRHGFVHLFAELFFLDCPVCLLWRGLVTGILLTSLVTVILFSLL